MRLCYHSYPGHRRGLSLMTTARRKGFGCHGRTGDHVAAAAGVGGAVAIAAVAESRGALVSGFLLHAAALVLLAPGGLLLLCALSTLLVGDVEARAAAFALYGFGSSHCW